MSGRLAAFLAPRSIALVGCPGDLRRPGARPLVFLVRHKYAGQIYPVNPRREEIGGFRSYPSLAALPERPDVVWIGVPGSEVEPVLAEAARLGVPHAIILTAGFGETDAAGRRRQARLRAIAEAASMTVLGPNMLGFVNCWDRVALTFSPVGDVEALLPGALGVASQSGALAGIVVNRAFDRQIGVSAMISTGNELGVTVSESLEYFADDPRTQAVALVAEGVRDGPRFRAAAARLLAAGKPLVAIKLGRSAPGRRNALTHTGALAGATQAWGAVARQVGLVEVETFEELVEVGGFLSRERRVVGRRVGVVTTSGGAAIMTADQLDARGFVLSRLRPATVEALAALLPEYALTRDNPVDVTAGLAEPDFERVLAAVTGDPGLDAVAVTVTGARGVERAQIVARAVRDASRPVAVCWLGGSLLEEGRRLLDAEGVTAFGSPRALAVALAAARSFAAAREAWRRRQPITTRASAVVAARGPVPRAALAALARRLRVPLAAERLVATPAAAAVAARRLGLPVALKVLAPEQPHKTDAGLVALGLTSVAAVRRAAGRLLARARGLRVDGLLVQRMAAPGIEVLVGVTRDPTFGLLLVVGAGGVHVELLGDAAWRPLPISRPEIVAMLGEVRALGVLGGVRGAPPADVPALVEAVAGLARLAQALGERLVSLEANPVIVHRRGRGAVAVDLRVALRPSAVGRGGGPGPA